MQSTNVHVESVSWHDKKGLGRLSTCYKSWSLKKKWRY